MPVGLIAGVVSGAASIGGALLSSKSQKKAAQTAADTSLQTAQANNALTQGIYNQNTANLRPFMQSGTRANALLDNLLYGYQPQQQQQPQQQVMGQNALMGGGGGAFQTPLNLSGISTGDEMQGNYGGALPGTVPGYAPQGAVTTSLPAGTGLNAWDAFRNSTNYQFRLGEGLKAANQGYAARGTLQSGAAMKGLNNYAQNFASNELGNWMNLLGNQQNLGLSGASALAGVGQNMVNNVTANNNSAASAAANAALMQGQANANFYGGIGNSLGNFAGTLASSYQKPW